MLTKIKIFSMVYYNQYNLNSFELIPHLFLLKEGERKPSLSSNALSGVSPH